MAAAAAHPQEPLLQSAALQIGLELLLHVDGQRPTLSCTQFTELRIALLPELIQQRALGMMRRVA
jgi:hypothetical protein